MARRGGRPGRASSGLWLAGALADTLENSGAAMATVCIPTGAGGLTAVLFALVPETRST